MLGLRFVPIFLLFLILTGIPVPDGAGKEYLTDKEIEKIQDTYDIDKRVKIYMEAAALRLKTAEDRLNGKESEPGDPLEFFTPEDMLDGYYNILRSVMMNLDDAAERPGRDNGVYVASVEQKSPREMFSSALKTLKSETEKAVRRLEVLKKIAEEKEKEELWNLVNSAIDVTNGAHEGAEHGLSKQRSSPDIEKTKK